MTNEEKKKIEDFLECARLLARFYDLKFAVVIAVGDHLAAAGNYCMVCAAENILEYCEENGIEHAGDGEVEKVH